MRALVFHFPLPQRAAGEGDYVAGGGAAALGTCCFHLPVLSFYFILFFKSMKQVKRQEESIMQIRSHLHNVS